MVSPSFITIVVLIFATCLSWGFAFSVYQHQRRNPGEDYFESQLKGLAIHLDQMGSSVSTMQYLAMLVGGPTVLFMLNEIMGYSKILGAVVSLAGLVLPELYVRYNAEKKKREYSNQFGTALSLIANSIKSGSSVESAIEEAWRSNLVHEEVRRDLRNVTNEVALGKSLLDAFSEFAERKKNPEVNDTRSAIYMETVIGGSRGQTIESIAKSIQDRNKMDSRLKAILSESKMTVYGVDVVPILIILILFFMAPAYLSVYFNDPLYFGIFIGILIMQLVGSIIVHALLRNVIR